MGGFSSAYKIEFLIQADKYVIIVKYCSEVRINLIYFYMTDPIADYLTRVRNAIKAQHRVVEIPASNLKKEITKILFDKGYILNYKFEEDGTRVLIKIA